MRSMAEGTILARRLSLPFRFTSLRLVPLLASGKDR